MITVPEAARVMHHRGGKIVPGLLAFPALLFLSACASTLPAPVVDLSQPATGGVTAKKSQKTIGDESGTDGGVIVSALPEMSAETSGTGIEPASGQSETTVLKFDDPSREPNPAVLSLLNRANHDQQNGDFARAAASIERALKIEPDNAWLWHRLALARFEQGQMGQATALAAKSNNLLGADPGNRALVAKNWLLIARVHTRRGEHVAAKAATDRARRIQSESG